MTRRIVVIGGGVVGSAVAAELSPSDRVSVTVVTEAIQPPLTLTHGRAAPGKGDQMPAASTGPTAMHAPIGRCPHVAVANGFALFAGQVCAALP